MFTEIKAKDICSNAFKMYPDVWALLSAGNEQENNCMTISWGAFGHLWYKDVVYVYARPSRYTYEFLEKEDTFVLSFLEDGHKKDLTYLGKTSGRDCDKVSNTSLTKTFIDGYPTFVEADYVIVCKKTYVSDIKLSEFVNEETAKVYKDDNIHRQYIGEILKVYKK